MRLQRSRPSVVISPAVLVLAIEQVKRGSTDTSLCALLAEIAFAPRTDGNCGRHYARARRPT